MRKKRQHRTGTSNASSSSSSSSSSATASSSSTDTSAVTAGSSSSGTGISAATAGSGPGSTDTSTATASPSSGAGAATASASSRSGRSSSGNGRRSNGSGSGRHGNTARTLRRLTTYAFVTLGALASIFPLYYMLVGSLQLRADSAFSGLIPKSGNLGLQNYRDVNRAISLLPSLANSAVFTLGSVVLTIVVGLPAGYALARLRFPGKPAVAGMLILVLVLPFQVMMIPLYILVVRDYGLADSYLGMILPFAVNATAVLIFRQFFVSLPDELFDAAHIDGAGELRTLLFVAAPLTKPAILTASVITFIGPWNEFLWPFLITKKHAMQPLAVSLGEYVSTNAATAANPYGVILAGACVLAVPVIALFLVAQRHFTSAALGSGVKE